MKRLALILLSFLLVACSVTKPVKIPEVKKYTLTQISTYRYNQHKRPAIYVSAVVANPGYETADMIYLKTPYELKAFGRSAWVSTPADIFHGLLLESLRHSNLFHAVIAPPYSNSAKYRIDTKLLMLQQEFITVPSQVRFAVSVTISNNMTNRVIAQRRFEVIRKASSDNPYGGVIAANRAAKILQFQIIRFVSKRLFR